MANKIVSALLGFSILFLSAIALAITPTPEQIEQFKRLPPEQQRALAQQYGVDLDSVLNTSSNTPIPPPVADAPIIKPRDVKPNESVLEQSITESSKSVTLDQKKQERTVNQKLEQFGYELFAGAPTTFAPATNIPIPSEYIIGPGDVVIVQLYGKENAIYELKVNGEGSLQFPEVGPMSVAGLSFDDLKKLINETISQKMIGVNSSITMGSLRSIQVFVLGEAYRPGSYTVSSLSTMTNALFVSGGVTKIGSLRNVQLKRNGKTVQELDLYDLLLEGDTSADSRLMPGDVLFIPPIGKTVGVSGEVRRPAIYEIKKEHSLGEVVALAGGVLPTAYQKATRVDRINSRGDRTLLNVDLSSRQGNAITIMDGDVVQVMPVLDKVEGIVLISGHVQRPGGVSWHQGMVVSDAIPSVNYLLPNPDLNYAIVKRENEANKTISVITINLGDAIVSKKASDNIALMPRDELYVFSGISEDRTKLLNEINMLLEKQASADQAALIASISGNVKYPGEYPLSKGMTAQSLINAAGGLTESAYSVEAEITRASLDESKRQVFTRIQLSLSQQPAMGGASLRALLNPRDQMFIKKTPNWNEKEFVEIVGEVNFPGSYPIYPGETIGSLVNRAGGLNERANPEGAIFLRESLRNREAEQIDKYKKQLETDLARMKIEAVQSKVLNPEAEKLGAGLLNEVSSARATGRLVVDLPSILKGNRQSDIELVKGDRIVLPRKTQEVSVVGEVQFPTSHLYRDGLNVFDYIDISGGLSPKANEDFIYVLSVNGQVKLVKKSILFGKNTEIKPGDTVVVPYNTYAVSSMSNWINVSQILFNLSTTAAALKAVGAF